MSTGNESKNGASTREQQYLAAVHEQVTLDDWKRILERAKKDAIFAAAGVRERTRRFLADYLIGKPTTRAAAKEDQENPIDRYAGFSDDELRALITAGKGESDRKRGGRTGLPTNGAAESSRR